MDGKFRAVLLTITNILLPTACLIFASGFFPYKPFLPGLASFHPLQYDDELPEAPFDKVIFMVVDALRSDFVFSTDSGFHFTQSLIADGNALPFTAHATAPTVTMPRVKAITTGSIPSFLDMVLNFAESDKSSSLANQDTWLAQMKAKKTGKLVMYGDDTWLKLFPEFFDRHDGTSSFFVSDFTEVDNNVTRHVPNELDRSDWNTMIMHYLGMDHIGHKAGPRSHNMIPKQLEMDLIVRDIYQAITKKSHLHSTLLVLCGDHGMTDGGNHGGSAAGETSPALVFASPKLKTLSKQPQTPLLPSPNFEYYDMVEQSDLAPTLSALLGIPVPLNNLGILIPNFLPLWPKKHQLQLLHRNALQMLDIVKQTFPNQIYSDINLDLDCSDPSESSMVLGCAWKSLQTNLDSLSDMSEPADELLSSFTTFCEEAQSRLSSTASNYDLHRIYIGIGVALVSFLTCLCIALPTLSVSDLRSALFLCFLILSYAAMMFASSYVEEEQQFWYWMVSAWLMIQYIQKSYLAFLRQKALRTKDAEISRLIAEYQMALRKNTIESGNVRTVPCVLAMLFSSAEDMGWPIVLARSPNVKRSEWLNYFVNLDLFLLISSRLLRRFNQSGQKHQGAQDIVSELEKNPASLLWPITLPMIIYLFQELSSKTAPGLGWAGFASKFFSAWLVLLLVSFRVGFAYQNTPWLLPSVTADHPRILQNLANTSLAGWLIVLCGLITLLIILQTLTQQWRRSPTTLRISIFPKLLPVLHVLLTLQTRTTNIPALLLCILQATALGKDRDPSQLKITLTTILLAHASFFAFGNTNSINTLDLSLAYNGITSYNPLPVGLLLFIGNWAAPIFWAFWGLATSTSSPSLPNKGHKARSWQNHVGLVTLWMSVEVLSIMLACTALREHLFVWTVFSPKFLFMCAWLVGWHLVVNVVVGGLLSLLD